MLDVVLRIVPPSGMAKLIKVCRLLSQKNETGHCVRIAVRHVCAFVCLRFLLFATQLLFATFQFEHHTVLTHAEYTQLLSVVFSNSHEILSTFREPSIIPWCQKSRFAVFVVFVRSRV